MYFSFFKNALFVFAIIIIGFGNVMIIDRYSLLIFISVAFIMIKQQ